MLFSTFAHTLEELEQLSSRLDMTDRLSQLFLELDPVEIAPATYLMQGSLVPSYESLEFQLSTKLLLKAIARTPASAVLEKQFSQPETLFGTADTAHAEAEVARLYKQVGDLGEVVAAWMASAHSTLSLLEVYSQLRAIAHLSGSGSQEAKIAAVAALLSGLDANSAKFVVRIIMGKVRLGFSAMTMLDALSWAVVGDKSHRKELELAYQKCADVGALARTYLADISKTKENHVEVLEQYSVTVGVPVVPALCHRLNTAQEIIDKMGEVIAEPKYDGLRVQIHFKRAGFGDGSTVRAYTRNLENVSHMFPELSQLADVVTVSELLLDSEAIGYNPSTNDLLPFTQTITRKRKHDIGVVSEKVPIKFFVFDVLLCESIGYMAIPLQERKVVLEGLFSKNRTFEVAPYLRTKDPIELREYHEEQLAKGLEGAVIKKIDSEYQPGRKGWKWVKIKEEEGTSGKLKDTLDVVIMGYYLGRGKRSQFGMGAVLVGVLDDQTNLVKTIAKVGTGLSEEQLVSIKAACDAVSTPTQPSSYEVDKSLFPDVWVLPHIVIEVAADEITRSPNHSAGVALRFPRLLRVRTDKSWEDATTLAELDQF